MRLPFLFIFFVLHFLICRAQFTPYFENYDISQYRAGNQNWDISEAADGRLYVANNQGLLQYDGLVFQIITIIKRSCLMGLLMLIIKQRT